ncbi:spermidine/putrescine ABC transporter ATPase [Thalassobacillus devorans]|uniref:Spermidine/putrescine import ATP-binding protein PotA n=1 Tax=Thalassobacillus devorans TaxID=279813 RepID=A0ABQ1NZW6_9BACI|nr:ABC transporter ATP-binding protein [Thalassobacillus devorans]NIK28214.1 spermidine/putrescine ABC transporter ATP-binding subunit [Thalassobacillus devorans]GGC87998.1 spermidine/putrescine ABC transporter ATPase [Thalassobacillus devorans]
MEELILNQVVKKFGDNVVVKNISLSIKKGELVSLLGPSGCGKSTTLRLISGFLEPDGGKITMNDSEVTHTPPNKRDTALVFQNYALFPHMTVAENVAYGLKMRKVPKSEIKSRVSEVLKMVHLDHFEDRYPGQLSGGQQQRVALARAIIVNPRVLLLDEPLSNLDAKLRDEMRNEILSLQKRLDLTCIFVTHDQEEALVLSDKIVVMDEGNIRQIGTPSEIFDSPKSYFTAHFVGVRNIFDGKVEDDYFITDKGLKVKLISTEKGIKHIGIRPNMVVLNPTDTTEYSNQFNVRINQVIYKGTIIELNTTFKNGENMVVEAPSEKHDINSLHVGDEVTLCWRADKVIPLFE